jgi:hypothetical protein
MASGCHRNALGVSHSNAGADCQCGELIDRITAGVPIRKLVSIEALGDVRMAQYQR